MDIQERINIVSNDIADLCGIWEKMSESKEKDELEAKIEDMMVQKNELCQKKQRQDIESDRVLRELLAGIKS